MRALPLQSPSPDRRRRGASSRPISGDDLAPVMEAVTRVAPNWTVELSAISPNDAGLVIMPENADDLVGPTFIVYRASSAIRLDLFQWDSLRGLGEFAALDDAIRIVVSILERMSLNAHLHSTLLH
jgi:hypothetical protein